MPLIAVHDLARHLLGLAEAPLLAEEDEVPQELRALVDVALRVPAHPLPFGERLHVEEQGPGSRVQRGTFLGRAAQLAEGHGG
jgi:hypothetical protein